MWRDDELRIRKTALHEMFHNVQRRYICDIGIDCGTDVWMGSPFGTWSSEGTARYVQDKLEIEIDLTMGDSTHYWDTVEAYSALMELVPYKRIGEPEDIARAAVWLASDHADYITGTSLIIDGGMTLYPGFTEGG